MVASPWHTAKKNINGAKGYFEPKILNPNRISKLNPNPNSSPKRNIQQASPQWGRSLIPRFRRGVVLDRDPNSHRQLFVVFIPESSWRERERHQTGCTACAAAQTGWGASRSTYPGCWPASHGSLCVPAEPFWVRALLLLDQKQSCRSSMLSVASVKCCSSGRAVGWCGKGLLIGQRCQGSFTDSLVSEENYGPQFWLYKNSSGFIKMGVFKMGCFPAFQQQKTCGENAYLLQGISHGEICGSLGLSDLSNLNSLLALVIVFPHFSANAGRLAHLSGDTGVEAIGNQMWHITTMGEARWMMLPIVQKKKKEDPLKGGPRDQKKRGNRISARSNITLGRILATMNVCDFCDGLQNWFLTNTYWPHWGEIMCRLPGMPPPYHTHKERRANMNMRLFKGQKVLLGTVNLNANELVGHVELVTHQNLLRRREDQEKK